jgi:hypothetical protein
MLRGRRLGAWALAGALVASSCFVGRVTAQAPIPNWTYLRDSGGSVWLVVEGTRLGIPLYPATDEEIAALPFAGKWVIPGEAPSFGDTPPDWAQKPAVPAPVTQSTAGSPAALQSRCYRLARSIPPATRVPLEPALIQSLEGMCQEAAATYGSTGVDCFEYAWTRTFTFGPAAGLGLTGGQKEEYANCVRPLQSPQ